jgi:hypothetical protein
MLNIDRLLFGSRITKTVKEWLATPGICGGNPFTPVILANEIDSLAAGELRRCAFELAKADPDDEAGFVRAVDAYDQAEAMFLDIHERTEVTL